MEKEIYLYPYSATEARARNELALWRASFCANVECARDIEEGIRTHFDGAHLDDAFLQPLVDKWGYRRHHVSRDRRPRVSLPLLYP